MALGQGEPGEVIAEATGGNVILFTATMGRVADLTIRQNGGGKFYAVDIARGRLLLENCDISSKSLACVTVHGTADPVIRQCRIHDGKQSGVNVYEQGRGTI